MSNQVRWDFLVPGPIRRLVLWPGFPVALQLLILTGVALLALNGWNIGPGRSADELLTLRKTNLTTHSVWGLWWPGMIVLTLLFGRIWCTICPLELVNRVGDAIARRIGWPRAKLGKLARAGWLTLLAYLLLQVLVAGASLHRVPHYTSLFLVSLLGLAFITGLIFRHPRSFCSSFCPAAALLSVYGRYTPVQLDKRDTSTCERCPTRDCVRESNRSRFDRRSCPSHLRPYDRRQSDGCVLCFQCAKVCPHGNIGFGLVVPETGTRRKRMLLPFEAAFIMVTAGFVAHEVFGEVKWLDRFFHFIPEQLHALASSVPFAWCEAVWYLVLFPCVVWVPIASIGYLIDRRAGLKDLLLSAATGAAPVVAVAHLAKAVAKIDSWSGFLPLALTDPAGEQSFLRLSAHSLAMPGRLMGLPVVGWVMLLALLWIGWRGLQWTRQDSLALPPADRTGLITTVVLFFPIIGVWCWS